MNKTWSAVSVVGRALANRPESRPLGSALRRSVAGFDIVGSHERGKRSIPECRCRCDASNILQHGEEGNPPGLFVPAGPSHLPCAGWEDRQTLTSFVPSSPSRPVLLRSDVMAITWMSEKSNPVDL